MLRTTNRVSVLIAVVVVLLIPVSGEAGSRTGSSREVLWRSALSWLADVWEGMTATPDGRDDLMSPSKPIDEVKPARGSAIDPNGSL